MYASQLGRQGQSQEDYLKTPGPGKVQLPDGRYVGTESILGKKYLGEVANEKLQQRQRQDVIDIMKTADPFSSQRAGYQTKLSDLMNNPAGAIASNPMFAASAEAGQEAAKRRLAQIGMGTSGNAAIELQKQAQANMSGDYFRMADLLSGLSGGKQDPSAGAGAGLQAMNMYENARQSDISKNVLPTSVYRPLTLGNLSNYWGK